MDLRLRGKTPFYKQITGTFNPVDIKHWIKSKFFDEPSPDVFTSETTFLDNYFLDEDYKRVLLERFKSNQNWFNIYVLGNWGQPQTGLEFYSKFSAAKHLEHPPEINAQAPLHITLDFNVVPYVTLCVWQIALIKKDDGEVVRTTAFQLDEICLKHPLNNTPSAAKRFLAKYGEHRGGVWVYGDPAGKARDTRREEGRNDFDIVFDILREMKPVDRVARSAPNVMNRGQWINEVLENDAPALRLRFANTLKNTIEDYEQVKQAADGSKAKKRVKDKETGVSFERYGHITDANDYFLCVAFESEFKNFQRGVPESMKRRIVKRSEVRSKGF